MQAGSGARSRLVSVVAAGALAAAALSTISAAPANAAVTVSGSTVDAAGNTSTGSVTAFGQRRPASRSRPTFTGRRARSTSRSTDGAYKLEFDGLRQHARDRVLPRQGRPGHRRRRHRRRRRPDPRAWTSSAARPSSASSATPTGAPVGGGSVEAFDAATGSLRRPRHRSTAGTLPRSAPRRRSSSGHQRLQSSTASALADRVLHRQGHVRDRRRRRPDRRRRQRRRRDPGPRRLDHRPRHQRRGCAAPPRRGVRAAAATCDYTDTNGVYPIEGVNTGHHVVSFTDPIGEFVGEYCEQRPADHAPPPTA